ncbi:MAG: hypothetical protein IPM95_08790 [Sphingobacteriales bacterium]|nr:hypothetical protein [Sphingobacteriales bacterium]
MKNLKLILWMLGSLFLMQNTFAQKGKITSAQLSLEEGKIMDAKKEIDAALSDAEVQKMAKAWLTKGDVYTKLYETKLFYAQNPKCLFDAKEAYLKGFDLETNTKKQKDYGTPLKNLFSYLFNEGFDRFKGNRYDDAYMHFQSALEINNFLFNKGFVSTLDTNVIFATAMSGANLNKSAEILPLLEVLVKMDYDNPAIYETLAQVYEIQKNKEALTDIVTKGLKKYPDNKNLKVYELNETLDNPDVRQSILKFEKAKINDPANASILFNLGVLYDKIHINDTAILNHLGAIDLKVDYGDAYFNLGVLYFNDGVAKNKEMNAVDDKVDKTGEIYLGLKSERDKLFAIALPYLEKAYSIDPKNLAYRSNLKKVYASMNMIEKARSIKDVSIGSTIEDVISILGQPKNISITTTADGTEKLYMYDNMTVNFDIYGKVNYINIIK